METHFPYVTVPIGLRKTIGERDDGTRLYRRSGSEREVAPWHAAICAAIRSEMVSLSAVAMYAQVSRAGVHKRLKSGRLTAFCFHVVSERNTRSGVRRVERRTPYSLVPLSEVKSWAAELAGETEKSSLPTFSVQDQPDADQKSLSSLLHNDTNAGGKIANASVASNVTSKRTRSRVAPPSPPGHGRGGARRRATTLSKEITQRLSATNLLATQTLHDSTLSTLRDLIVEGVLRPGQRLTERALSKRLSVSRTPLREALRVLAQEGMVELLSNRGARVATLTEEDVGDLFVVIGTLEAMAGRLACERITAEELAEIKAVHRQMVSYYRRSDLHSYFRLNQVIHELIVQAARNPVLKATYSALCGRLSRPRYQANQNSPERWAAAIKEHEQIIDALSRRAADELAHILNAHLHHKYEAICRHL